MLRLQPIRQFASQVPGVYLPEVWEAVVGHLCEEQVSTVHWVASLAVLPSFHLETSRHHQPHSNLHIEHLLYLYQRQLCPLGLHELHQSRQLLYREHPVA